MLSVVQKGKKGQILYAQDTDSLKNTESCYEIGTTSSLTNVLVSRMEVWQHVAAFPRHNFMVLISQHEIFWRKEFICRSAIGFVLFTLGAILPRLN
jgi:hypothetical protein